MNKIRREPHAPLHRILIVEDDKHTRRINALALGAAGYEINEAVNIYVI